MKKLEGYQKGVNLGGWISQGPLDKNHLDTFIGEADIKRIKEMGCDHLRLPVDFENIEDGYGNEKSSGYTYIDNCISWCKKYELNIVLDLHKTPGYVFDDTTHSKGFFDDEVLQSRFYAIWDRLSKRYVKYSNMMMFELLNEITSFDYAEAWNRIAAECIAVIRRNAPTVKILLGGVGYSATNAVKLLPKPMDSNIVYNVHCYEPIVFTHQGAYWVDSMPPDFRLDYPGEKEDYIKAGEMISASCNGALKDNQKALLSLDKKEFFLTIFKEAVEYAEANDTTLYCGEYGVINLADPEDSLRWIKDINYCFEYYGIGRALWNYKEKDFGVIDSHMASVFDEYIKYL